MEKNLLSIGWASADISTEGPINLPGQFHMRISTGILDPITATALWISNGKDDVCFLSIDLVTCRGGLTDAPISGSDNILLTAVGNCDNTDAQYNDDHTVQYSKGHGPIEAEVIEAEIVIENKNGDFRVDAIGDSGMQVGSASPENKDGKIIFKTGGNFPSVHYLIQKI